MGIVGDESELLGEQRLRTVKEAAEELGQSRKTVYAKIAAGELSAFRLGQRGPYRISDAALAEHVQQPGGGQGVEARRLRRARPRHDERAVTDHGAGSRGRVGRRGEGRNGAHAVRSAVQTVSYPDPRSGPPPLRQPGFGRRAAVELAPP